MYEVRTKPCDKLLQPYKVMWPVEEQRLLPQDACQVIRSQTLRVYTVKYFCSLLSC